MSERIGKSAAEIAHTGGVGTDVETFAPRADCDTLYKALERNGVGDLARETDGNGTLQRLLLAVTRGFVVFCKTHGESPADVVAQTSGDRNRFVVSFSVEQ